MCVKIWLFALKTTVDRSRTHWWLYPSCECIYLLYMYTYITYNIHVHITYVPIHIYINMCVCETTILQRRPLSLAFAYSAERIIPPFPLLMPFPLPPLMFYSSSLSSSHFRFTTSYPRSLFPRAYIEQSGSINFLANSIPDPQYTRHRVGTPREL